MQKTDLLSIILGLLLFPALMTAQEYTGIVVPLDVSTYAEGTDAPFYGYIGRVARLGQIIKPPVLDSKGNFTALKEGNIVLEMNKKYFEAQVYGSEAAVRDSIIQLKLAEINYRRYMTLYKENAASQEQLENTMNTYCNDYYTYYSNLAALAMNEAFLEDCTDYAPYEGLISNVYVIEGDATWQNIVETTQLNPIGVEIKIDREEAKKIGIGTQVKIIPLNTNIPQGIFSMDSMLTDKGILFFTENYPVLNKSELIPEDGIPVYRNCMPVIKFYIDSDAQTLAVHKDSVKHDSGGSYVWKAQGQKTMQADRGIDPKFKIEKVYVKLNGLRRSIAGYDEFAALEDAGTLELNDITLLIGADELKNGQEVYFPDQRYLLMPGDEVKVIIGD